MTFEKWLEENDPYGGFSSDYVFLSRVWNAATLAERERLKEVISVDYKFFNENYSGLPGEVGQYYAGRLDSYDEVLHAINNP